MLWSTQQSIGTTRERSGPKSQIAERSGERDCESQKKTSGSSVEREVAERGRSDERAESAALGRSSLLSSVQSVLCSLQFTSRLDFGGNPMTFYLVCPHFHPDDQSWSL